MTTPEGYKAAMRETGDLRTKFYGYARPDLGVKGPYSPPPVLR